MGTTAQEAGLGRSSRSAAAAPSGYRQRGVSPVEAFGGGAANTAAQAGRGLEVAARAFEIDANEQARIQATEAVQEFQRETNGRLFNGEAAWLSRKGSAALGVSVEGEKELETARERYAAKLSPVAARLFNESAGRVITSASSSLSRFEMAEQKTAKSQAAQSQINMEVENVALNYNDDDALGGALRNVTGAVATQASIEGWPVERLNEEMWRQTSKVRAAQIAQLAATGGPADVLRAKQKFDAAQESGDLTIDHVNTLERTLSAAVPKAEADIAYGAYRGGTANLSSMTADDVFGALLQQESGGRHRDESGNLITSPKGAQGIAQLMPETAANPGFGIEPARDDSEAENMRVGKEYLQKMHERYGSMELALMAYNAGPAVVDDHIKKRGKPVTKTDVEQFVASFPYQETREYVPSVKKRLGAASLQVNDSPALIAQRAEMYAPKDPVARELFMKRIQSEQKAVAEARKAQGAQIEEMLFNKLYATNGDISQLTPMEIKAAQEFDVWDKVRRYDGVTNPDYKMELLSMRSEALADTQLDRSQLSQADYEKFFKVQKDYASPQGKVTQKRVDDVVNYVFASDFGVKEDDAKVKAQKGLFKDRIMLEIDEYVERNGKTPDGAEISRIANNLAKARVYDSGNFLFGQDDIDNIYTAKITDIDEAMRSRIERQLIAQGEPVSEVTVMRYFQEMALDENKMNLDTEGMISSDQYSAVPVPEIDRLRIIDKLRKSGIEPTAARVLRIYREGV